MGGASEWAEITAADVAHGVGVVSAAALGFWSGYGYGQSSFAFTVAEEIALSQVSGVRVVQQCSSSVDVQ